MKTIAAIATAPVSGPVGILRLSGDEAIRIAEAVFSPANGKKLSQCAERELIYGNLINGEGKIIDSCLAVRMPGPHSYTGEDCAEIHCHGSMEILRQGLAALFAQGAQPAAPGEYTKRAFLNGKMGLSEAEAVNDLICAQTAQAVENAAAQMRGVMGKKIQKIRQDIMDIVSNFYAVVDFPDEEIDESLFEKAQEVLHNATGELYALAESYEKGRMLREGIPCAILGKPNAGKSSILNAMAGFDRAIVTDIPGTTRDIVEECVQVGPVVLRLADTAGLRETEDPVERIGIQKAMERANEAALVLSVFDSSSELTDEDLMVIARAGSKRSIAIINKEDLECKLDIGFIKSHFQNTVEVSVKTGEGIPALMHMIEQVIGVADLKCDGELITNARQAAALARAAERCEESFFAAESGMTPDAVVMDAEGAIAALGEVTGQSVTDDIVDNIFANFCVGK